MPIKAFKKVLGWYRVIYPLQRTKMRVSAVPFQQKMYPRRSHISLPGIIYTYLKGLADAFIKMRLPYDSEEAARLNRDIFETIYFGAVNASVEVSEKILRNSGL